MGYESKLSSACPVIDDSNYQNFMDVTLDDGTQAKRGMKPRDWNRHPYGAVAGTAPFPSELLIPENEWEDRIKEQEAEKSSLEHIADAMGVQVKNQGQTNYCWVNAPTHCVELLRAKQGQPFVELSPASVGAPVNDYQNEGGWGPEAVKYIAANGLVPSAQWPNNAIDRKYFTDANNALRKKYQIDAWWDLRPKTIAETASCVLRNIPVAVGLNWWSHEVTYIRLLKVNGVWVFKFDNSWGTSWGEKGRGVLSGQKMIPDDCIAPRLATAA